VVVGRAYCGGYDPSIWTENDGMRRLADVLFDLGLSPEMEGWDLEEATAVSGDGRTVVGWGYNPAGEEEAWVAYLGQPSVVEIPAASGLGLAMFGALLATAALAVLHSRRSWGCRPRGSQRDPA
jgi:hypothetical protein